MKSRYALTPQAEQDLKDILLRLAEDSPRAAELVRRRFAAAMVRLVRNPALGHYREEIIGRRYRFWSFYSYLVVYSWETRPIVVIAIVHGARELNRFLVGR